MALKKLIKVNYPVRKKPLFGKPSPLFFENLIINGAIICGHGREKQISGKVKRSNRGRKRNSARPRYLLV